jgi:hypothetical protein
MLGGRPVYLHTTYKKIGFKVTWINVYAGVTQAVCCHRLCMWDSRYLLLLNYMKRKQITVLHISVRTRSLQNNAVHMTSPFLVPSLHSAVKPYWKTACILTLSERQCAVTARKISHWVVNRTVCHCRAIATLLLAFTSLFLIRHSAQINGGGHQKIYLWHASVQLTDVTDGPLADDFNGIKTCEYAAIRNSLVTTYKSES